MARGQAGYGYAPGTKNSIIATNSPSAAVLAHGYGHFVSDKKLPGSSKLGQAAHRAYAGIGTKPWIKSAKIASPIAGFASGYNSEVQKSKGKKEHIISRIAPYAVPLLATAPVLVSEATASTAGLRALKNAGASKEYMKIAKRTLAPAFGTYATGVLQPLGLGVIGRQAGKITARAVLNSKNKKEQDQNTSDSDK